MLRFVLALLCVTCGAWPLRSPAQDRTAPVAAEEIRLSNKTFRAGLRKRGLTEILALHLKQFPPGNTLESLLAMRDVRRAEFADHGLSMDERRTAIAEANKILEELLAAYPKDHRRFQWRFDLAHSLLYDEAEPLVTTLLYHGGDRTNRGGLLELTSRALGALTILSDDLAREYVRLDHMSIAEFERLESGDYIDQLDRLGPRTDYVMLWALLYDALPRSEEDPARARRLHEILAKLSANADILDTPHSISGIRIQALVLAGMTYRRLQRNRVAHDFFDRAILEGMRLDDETDRLRIGWAITLARLEQVRNAADDDRFADALELLQQFRSAADTGGNFGIRLVAALLERYVYRRRADMAEQSERSAAAARYRRMAWSAPAKLADQEPDRRDEVYAALYQDIGPDADPEKLDPFEQCAFVAGLLFDAEQESESVELLDRAIDVADRFLARQDDTAKALIPEVLFNSAVACYRRGRPADAVQRFVTIAKEHTAFVNALAAASLAVQIGSESYRDPALHDHSEVKRLYRDALHTLVTQYSNSDAAKFWRFFYAQLLDELEEHDRAATQYALVEQTHEHYVLSVAARGRCLATVVMRLAEDASSQRLELQQRTNECFEVHRAFVPIAMNALSRTSEPDRKKILRELLAQSRIETAEVYLLAHVERAGDALASLSDFEERFSKEQGLLGRVWRVRLMAYDKLGMLNEAALAIPAFVSANPKSAGPTLQAIYQRLADDLVAARTANETPDSGDKTKMVLLLAEQIHAWANQIDRGLTGQNLRAIEIQLGEANLWAGNNQQAREIFERLLPPNEDISANAEPQDPRVQVGFAEAMFQLGQWSLALPRFNRLALSLPPTSPQRWKCLLRDLECRTKLGHPPRGIVQVIEQQKFLHPDLGGAFMATRFERLLRENQRRLDD